MDLFYLSKELENSKIVKHIQYFETISSTNNFPKENEVIPNTLLLANNQTDGRGKDQRKWYTREEESIAMTLYLKPKCHIEKLDGFTISIAEKIREMFKEKYEVECTVKKPNDLLLNDKKFCGILVETILEKEIVKELIIGIGMNINQDEIDNEIKDIATSLKKETNKTYKREEIIKDICMAVEECIGF